MPEDATLGFFAKQYPAAYEWLTSGEIIQVRKDQPLDLSRAIWYNELDKRHTFNTRNRNAGANCGVIAHIVAEEMARDVPSLRLQYLAACVEFQEESNVFTRCEEYMQAWQKPAEDLLMVTPTEHKVFQKMKKYHSDRISEAHGMDSGSKEQGSVTHAERGDEMDEDRDEVAVMQGFVRKENHAEGRDDVHDEWMFAILTAMGQRVEELVNQNPADLELMIKYNNQMTGVTLAMEGLGM